MAKEVNRSDSLWHFACADVFDCEGETGLCLGAWESSEGGAWGWNNYDKIWSCWLHQHVAWGQRHRRRDKSIWGEQGDKRWGSLDGSPAQPLIDAGKGQSLIFLTFDKDVWKDQVRFWLLLVDIQNALWWQWKQSHCRLWWWCWQLILTLTVTIQ